MTIFLGGLAVILPVAILVKVFIWLFYWATGAASILLICVLIGLLVRTTWGKWIQSLTERWFLERIPGYKTLKELLSNIQPNQKRDFSRPVLISLDKSENYFLGFITDQYDDNRYAVFIPTSPSPVNGFVVQTNSEHIKFVNTKAESMMKTVISCGVGSADIMASIQATKPAET